MIRGVFIARDARTGFHSVLQVVHGDTAPEPTAPMEYELAEELVRWRSLDALVSALSKTGPLIGRDIYDGERRRLEICDVIEALEGSAVGEGERFARCDKDSLFLQLCLEGTSTTGSPSALYPSLASIPRDVKRHGLIESGAIADLKAWAGMDPACRVIVELLHDIVLCRNLGSVLLRTIANVRSGYEDVLERSGFVLDGSRYVLPFQHNTGFEETVNFSDGRFRKVYAWMVAMPLERRMLDFRSSAGEYRLGWAPNAVLLGAKEMADKLHPFSWKPEIEETQIFLGIDGNGTQKEVAVRFVDGTVRMLSGLKTETGDPLGWSMGYPSVFEAEARPSYRFHSTMAAMFGAIFYRSGYAPATCKNCGNGMLVKAKGKRRQFCCDSCRVKYHS